MFLKLNFYGHAALGLEVDSYQLLVDPFLDDNPCASIKSSEVAADYILVTHAHGDHLGDIVAIAKRTGAVVITVFEIANWLEARGVKTHAQHLGGGHTFPFGYLKLTLALHGSALPDGSYGGNPAGFLLTNKAGERIYLAGDTGLFGDMKLIGEEGIDIAVLPIGDNYTMGPADALRAVKLLMPGYVIPIHYDTFELIEQDAQAWKDKVERETAAKVVVLKPGGSFQLQKDN
ncbi:MAG TPA: metal-dependent hydrolase [Anaerolineae bacterium]|nr:metal-dependent hydrolase [Anaerolineae bacterium]